MLVSVKISGCGAFKLVRGCVSCVSSCGLGSIEASVRSAISEIRNLVCRATTNICLHAEWFLVKKLASAVIHRAELGILTWRDGDGVCL